MTTGLIRKWLELGNASRRIKIPSKPDDQPTAAGAAMLVCADELEKVVEQIAALRNEASENMQLAKDATWNSGRMMVLDAVLALLDGREMGDG